MSKRTKNGIMFYHLEAGVTVVGPHLDSSRQLARKITLAVTSHQLGDSPKKSRWKCSSRICHDSECWSGSTRCEIMSYLGFRTSSNWKLKSQSAFSFPIHWKQQGEARVGRNNLILDVVDVLEKIVRLWPGRRLATDWGAGLLSASPRFWAGLMSMQQRLKVPEKLKHCKKRRCWTMSPFVEG